MLSSRHPLLKYGWSEWETKVHEVISFDPTAGKSGKGIVKYWESARDNSGKGWTRSCGQFHAFDVEDVITIR